MSDDLSKRPDAPAAPEPRVFTPNDGVPGVEACRQCPGSREDASGAWFCEIDKPMREVNLRGPPPSWCPLRAQPILLKIREGV